MDLAEIKENFRLEGRSVSNIPLYFDDAVAWLIAAVESLTAEQEAAERDVAKDIKQIAVDFFYWWHNQPGTNTEEGFDRWWATVAQYHKDALHGIHCLQSSLAQAREEIERLKEHGEVFRQKAEAAEQREKGLREALVDMFDPLQHRVACQKRLMDKCMCAACITERAKAALRTALLDPETIKAEVATERAALAAASKPTQELAKFQPCGCVVCTCEENEENRCMGCGAKNCGTHPVGEFPNPLYVAAASKEGADDKA